MATVLITVHLIIVLFLIVVVLLQRSEGGGLGIGGGGGGMMSARQATDGLTKTTTVLAAAFFATSLALGILARYSDDAGSILDRAEQVGGEEAIGGGIGSGGILDQLGGEIVAPETPVAPVPAPVPEPIAPSPAPLAPATE